MDATHLHLMLTHAPIVGTFVAVWLLSWGVVRRSRDVGRVALVLALLLGPTTWAVVESGEAAEEEQEHSAWLEEALVHEHEERGEVALVGSLVFAGVAAAGLLLGRGGREVPRWALGGAFSAGVVAFGLLAWTGAAGGAIRHDEVRGAGAVRAR